MFRIVHVAVDGYHRALGDAVREQRIDITVGPKVSPGSRDVGAVMRRVAANRVVTALPKPRTSSKLPKEARTPHVAKLLRKGMEWQRELDTSEVDSQAAIARREGITRARVTQIMALLRLAPEIQEEIRAIPCACRRTAVTERALRPIARLELPDQLAAFQRLVRSDVF